MEQFELFNNYNLENINKTILDIADYIYTKTHLKPMSKTVFFLSRILLQRKYNLNTINYNSFISKYNIKDDYNFWEIFENLSDENRNYLLSKIDNLLYLSGTDILGNLFNTLIHGKFEAGEGLGSFLTPDEVVKPTVVLANYLIKLYGIDITTSLIGDITGGTGNFLLHFYQTNRNINIKQLKIYDQSSLHLGLANINFLLQENDVPNTHWTTDSLTEKKIYLEKNKYSCLLTNPPFGMNTYYIKYNLDIDYKKVIGIKNKIDPSWLFLLKNLEILSSKGLLAIILPNGIYKSKKFIEILKLFEKKNKCKLSIPFLFELPIDTFSLAGTVAKTGVIFITKNLDIDKTNYIIIEQIGFYKKCNNKVKSFNQYMDIVNNIVNNNFCYNSRYFWKDVEYLHEYVKQYSTNTKKLSDLSILVKEYVNNELGNYIHIPVDAVDEYGIIHFDKCLINKMPKSKPIKCNSGDILVSCINPRIWRVVKIPYIKNINWNCSSEFIVLRAKKDKNELFMYLLSKDVKDKAIKLANGTSSSRQRVNKKIFLDIDINLDNKNNIDINKYDQINMSLYEYIISI